MADMQASDWLEQALCEHMRGTALPLPSGFFVSLHTADPGDTGANEVTTTNWTTYARQSLGAISGAWSDFATDADYGGKVYTANARAVTFPANPSSTAVNVTHVGVWDSATGGNLWFHAPLVNLQTDTAITVQVSQGRTVPMSAGWLRFYPPPAFSTYRRNGLLAHLRGTQLPTAAAVFVALDTGDPSTLGGGSTEVTTTLWPSYARVSLGTPLSAGWSTTTNEVSGGGKYVSNVNALTFPPFDGATSISVTAVSMWDSATGGNMLVRGSIGAAVSVDANSQQSFAAGGLRISVR